MEDLWLNTPLLILSDAEDFLSGDAEMLGQSMGQIFFKVFLDT